MIASLFKALRSRDDNAVVSALVAARGLDRVVINTDRMAVQIYDCQQRNLVIAHFPISVNILSAAAAATRP